MKSVKKELFLYFPKESLDGNSGDILIRVLDNQVHYTIRSRYIRENHQVFGGDHWINSSINDTVLDTKREIREIYTL